MGNQASTPEASTLDPAGRVQAELKDMGINPLESEPTVRKIRTSSDEEIFFLSFQFAYDEASYTTLGPGGPASVQELSQLGVFHREVFQQLSRLGVEKDFIYALLKHIPEIEDSEQAQIIADGVRLAFLHGANNAASQGPAGSQARVPPAEAAQVPLPSSFSLRLMPPCQDLIPV